MTDRAKKKEAAKKEIRSLLLSAPLGLTITELKKDFLEFIGRPLPWKDLGYNNPEEFIQDIPDTVKVTWGNTGMVLTGVANTSTRHIEKLVQNQKVDTKVKKKVTARRIRSSSHMLPPRNGGWNSQGGYPRGQSVGGAVFHRGESRNMGPPRMQQRARHLATPPCVPAFVRGQISQLVAQHPEGLPLTHFCAIFRRYFGVALDFRGMGFSTDQDMLSSLRDIVGMRTLSGGETRVLSIQHCVAFDQRRWNATGTSNNNNNSISGGSGRKTLLPLNNGNAGRQPLIASNPPQPQKSLPPKGRGRGMLRKDGNSALGASNSHDFNRQNSDNSHYSGSSAQLSNPDANPDTLKLEKDCNIPVAVQDEIRQIMKKRPKGVCASRLPFEYKGLFGKALPFKTYGYNSVIEFVSDLPHIIRIERPHPQGDWHLFSTQPPEESQVTSSQPVTEAKADTPGMASVTGVAAPPLNVDTALRESVAQVLCINPDGIPLNKFQDTYQAVTGKSLNVARYGPGGLKRILHSMSDILIISLDAAGSDTQDNAIVLPKTHNGPRRFDQLQAQFRPVANSGNNEGPDALLHLPKDAVSPGCRYRPQHLPPPTEAEGDNYIELYVSNVISPGMFWIQLRGRETTLALEDLMDDLEDVYNSKSLSQDYNMTSKLAQMGMPCAVIFPEDSFWHRGFITGFKDQLYQVYFVDYGNTCYVSIDQMKLLKTKFMKLPAQAIQARLGHIRPINGVWRTSSKTRLLDLAREKPLVGLVVGEKDRILSLCLTDTSKEEDIHFNDVFVDEGYAVFEPENESVPAVNLHEQAPSTTFLFGASSTDGPADQVTTETRQEPTQRFVRQAQMMDDVTMNLVNFQGQLYLTSTQISALFFQQDIISAKLRHDKADVTKVVVDKRSCPGLFTELILYETPDVDESTEYISLFALAGLPLIIGLYDKSDALDEMKATALEILQWFDPDDPFWRGEDDAASMASQDDCAADADDDDEVGTQSSADDAVPALEDLQLVLRSMEIKRKRILARMLAESPTPECVNELNIVELHIKRVEGLIAKLEADSVDDLQPPAYETGYQTMGSLPSLEQPRVAQPTPPKTTHKVAPMVQARAAPQPLGQVKDATMKPGESNQAPVDFSSWLQHNMMMNQMMMQQLGLATQNNPLRGQMPSSQLPGTSATTETNVPQMLRGVGRGVATTEQQQQQQQQQQLQQQQQQLQHLQLLQSQLLQGSGALTPGSGLSLPAGSILQGSQLLSQKPSQEVHAFNAQLASLGMMNNMAATSGALSTASTTTTPTGLAGSNLLGSSVPPGLMASNMYGLPGRGQMLVPGGAALTPQASMLGGAMSGPQSVGLQGLMQRQQQSSLAYSALQQQQQRQQQSNLAYSALQQQQQHR